MPSATDFSTPARVLRYGREQIADPERWSPDGRGYPHRKCALQALPSDYPEYVNANIYREALRFLRSVLPNLDVSNSIAEFNDSHTHSEVLDLYDQAIEAASDREEALV